MLDFSKLIPQMKALTDQRTEFHPRVDTEKALAIRTLQEVGPDPDPAARRIEESRTSWLLAEIQEPPGVREVPSPAPPRYAALATDGSQIAPDRHEIAFCYLINVGSVALHYGEDARARMESHPRLAFEDAEMFEEMGGDRLPITAKRLAARRLLAECEELGRLIEEAAAEEKPAIAMSDGSLILWTLETEPAGYRSDVLGRFMDLLETARRCRVPLVGYISRPGSRDVVNALRVQRCVHERADCDRYCPEHAGSLRTSAPCSGTEHLTDRALFEGHLEAGQRSALFGSRSKILEQYAEAHRIVFFYLHTGYEIARIEIPAWVAEDAALLAQAHALVCDQVRKGAGYLRALTEAHERAVVRGAERAAFFQMLEREFARRHVPAEVTRKALSKRTRSV